MQILDNLSIGYCNPRATPKPWVAGSNPPAPVKTALESRDSEAVFVFILLIVPERGMVSNCDKVGVAVVQQCGCNGDYYTSIGFMLQYILISLLRNKNICKFSVVLFNDYKSRVT